LAQLLLIASLFEQRIISLEQLELRCIREETILSFQTVERFGWSKHLGVIVVFLSLLSLEEVAKIHVQWLVDIYKVIYVTPVRVGCTLSLRGVIRHIESGSVCLGWLLIENFCHFILRRAFLLFLLG